MERRYEEVNHNPFLGLIGLLIGAILGAIVYYVVSKFNYIHIYISALGSFLSLAFYERLGKKVGIFAIIMSIIVNVVLIHVVESYLIIEEISKAGYRIEFWKYSDVIETLVEKRGYIYIFKYAAISSVISVIVSILLGISIMKKEPEKKVDSEDTAEKITRLNTVQDSYSLPLDEEQEEYEEYEEHREQE